MTRRESKTAAGAQLLIGTKLEFPESPAGLVDDRVEADVEGGWGAALSLSHTVGQRWLPFVRGGFSDGGGAIADRTVSAGIGYQLSERKDYFGIGLN